MFRVDMWNKCHLQTHPLEKKNFSEICKCVVDGSKRLSAFLRLTSVCTHECGPRETEDGVPLLPRCLLVHSRMNYCLTTLSELFLRYSLTLQKQAKKIVWNYTILRHNVRVSQKIINNFFTTYNQ